MESLAVKYRPKEFNEVVSQTSIIKILEKQIELNKIKHCYLFCGPSGCGKTTIARALANKINNNLGNPIEIDAASNNGVDNIRNIIEDASFKNVDDSKYKIFIIDECHMLTTQSWNALLKTIEEPPKYTIFMFCTTDPQKIPQTILSRVMRFNLTKIPTNLIRDRLEFICNQEGFTNYNDTIEFISKLANGGMRTAISYLEKVSDYSKEFNIKETLNILGDFSYELMFELTNGILDGNYSVVLSKIDDLYNNGYDLKLFIEKYLEFILDILKYCTFNNLDLTKIPQSYLDDVVFLAGEGDNKTFFSRFVDRILEIKNTIKYDTNIKSTIEVMLTNLCRGV